MKYPTYHVNVDSVDIKNRQIGVHNSDCVNREFCIGVNHLGTKESVKEATRIARLLAAAPEMYEELTQIYRFIEPAMNKGTNVVALDMVNRVALILAKIEGFQNA